MLIRSPRVSKIQKYTEEGVRYGSRRDCCFLKASSSFVSGSDRAADGRADVSFHNGILRYLYGNHDIALMPLLERQGFTMRVL